ncbi:sigma-70 family RNA polymerase sigma factor [Gulosibacter chungangensis]|uniref:RNA polymerase sigma factor n=1 Tax=Gulosibacter chungangensis TaxID=979746 RepID=A0A7J5BGX3_9MICO|nr:sigma-70 family RNA polymerase sigma factor [Gulosibacter chungangensis]KAB1644870.1 sigma-70 family RNA polymerase sigma factor [Gulosibacter chungangensis]
MTETLSADDVEPDITSSSRHDMSALQSNLSPEIIAAQTVGLSSLEIAELIQALQQQQIRAVAAERATSAVAAMPLDLGLFDWQREALDKWKSAGKIGVVEAVTGTGKTRVGLAAIQEARAHGFRAVVYVPSLALQRQWIEQIESLLPDLRVIGQADPRTESDWDVTVITIQTAIRRKILPANEQALLVADECHRYGAPQFQKGLRLDSFPIRLGLSATRTRGDSGDAAIEEFFEQTCFNLDYERAVKDELIAPFKVAFVRVPFTPREREAYELFSNEMRDVRSKLLDTVPAEPLGEFMSAVQRLANDRAHRKSGLARWYLKRFSDRRNLLASSEQKQHALRALTPVVAASNGTLVFTQTKSSAESAAQILSEEGVSSAAVDSGVESDDRVEVIRLLGAGQMKALAAPTLLDEGIDLPNVDLGIVVSATHQRRQMIQRFGRVLRKKSDGSTAKFVIFVLAGSSEDPSSITHEPTLADELRSLAEAAENFDLSIENELGRLVSFLEPGIDPQSITSFDEIATNNSDEPEAEDDAPDADDGSIFVPNNVPQIDDESIESPGSTAGPIDSSTGPFYERVVIRRVSGTAEDPSRFPEIAGPGDDGDKYYQNDIRKNAVLSREEERTLMERIRAGEAAGVRIKNNEAKTRAERKAWEKLVRVGDEARTYFIVSNLRLVKSIALSKYPQAKRLELMDLIQEGNIGLLRAIEKFDHTRGTKFSTYATYWIRQSIDRGVDNTDRLIRLPVHVVGAVRKIEQAKKNLRREHGREASIAELAETTELSQEKVLQSLKAEWRIDPLDSIPSNLVDDEQSMFEEAIESRDIDARFRAAMDWLLDKREIKILKMRYGIDTVDGKGRTLDQIGVEFGVTRERIRQIERDSMTKLRDALPDFLANGGGRDLSEPQLHDAVLRPGKRHSGMSPRPLDARPSLEKSHAAGKPITGFGDPVLPSATLPAPQPESELSANEIRDVIELLELVREGDSAAKSLNERDSWTPTEHKNLTDLDRSGKYARAELVSRGLIQESSSPGDLNEILTMVKESGDQSYTRPARDQSVTSNHLESKSGKKRKRTSLQINLSAAITKNWPQRD